jgi:type IV pilus assembly protein PilC
MIYPVAVIVIAGLVVGVILWKVIPTFASLFAGLAPTCRCRRASSSARNGLVSASRSSSSPLAASARAQTSTWTENGRRTIDALSLKAPILGNIMRKIAVARFCRTLSTLISSGVPILDGLKSPRAPRQRHRRRRDRDDAQEHRARRDHSVPLKETKIFPPMVTQMIGVGEATGALDTMLAKIADFYEEEVDTASPAC